MSESGSAYHGVLPEVDVEYTESNAYSVPPGDRFKVRGADYLSDRVKYPSKEPILHCVGVDLFRADGPYSSPISRKEHLLVRRAREEGKNHFFLVVNFLMPYGSFVCYFAAVKPEQNGECVSTDNDEAFDRCWQRFMEGDAEYRNKRLKILPLLVDAPWAVKMTIGYNCRPAILGTKVDMKYFVDNELNYMEWEVNLPSSTIATGILNMVRSYVTYVTMDLVFIIEGQEEDELPERVLGGVRFHKLDFDSAPSLETWQDLSDDRSRSSEEVRTAWTDIRDN
ncbi:MAG: hypothetical protein MHM6MM_001606 [Cercozoa sp. M6MM]